ncbi:hypothetical protein Plhal304r1_c006g0025351 [Plasmopara halstedii]
MHNVVQKVINTRAYSKGKKTLKQLVDDHVRNYLNKRRDLDERIKCDGVKKRLITLLMKSNKNL